MDIERVDMNSSVLVVDDEENLLVLLDWILTKEGFYVKTASDADRALHLLDEETFDMAILDIQMYPMDGIRLLSELRKRSPSTAVIMTTAYPAPDILSECVEHGADALLAKPVDLDELKNVARSLADLGC